MTIQDILRHVDHTMLKVDEGWPAVEKLCAEAVQYRTASVCIPPCYVQQAVKYLGGKVPVCTVIGFPNGYATTAVKCTEAADAVANGAEEIDMVINIGWLKTGEEARVQREIELIKTACRGKLLKVIVETCLLSQIEKIRVCGLVTRSGADYIKTSTGFSSGGATLQDIRLFAQNVGPKVKIKAAGGISTLQDARDFLLAGADRLGTSRLVDLARRQELTTEI